MISNMNPAQDTHRQSQSVLDQQPFTDMTNNFSTHQHQPAVVMTDAEESLRSIKLLASTSSAQRKSSENKQDIKDHLNSNNLFVERKRRYNRNANSSVYAKTTNTKVDTLLNVK